MAKLVIKVLTKFLAPVLIGIATKGLNKAWQKGFGHETPAGATGKKAAAKTPGKPATNAQANLVGSSALAAGPASTTTADGPDAKHENADANEVQRGLIELVTFAVASAAIAAGVNAVIENGTKKALRKKA